MRKGIVRMTSNSTAVDHRTARYRHVSVLVSVCLTLAAVLVAWGASSASASFGVSMWDGQIPVSEAGGTYTQAGGHPFEISTTIGFNRRTLWVAGAVSRRLDQGRACR